MRLSLTLLPMLLVVAACATETEESTPSATNDAVIASDPATADAAALMNEVWSGHEFDYLPWAYSPDGCFARSYWMSMEFASRGIPVREQIINLRWNADSSSNKAQFEPVVPGTADVVTYQGRQVKWQYHIAAVLVPGPKVNIAEPMVIDRALEPGPVTVDQWVADANANRIPLAPVNDAPVTADADGEVTRGMNKLKTKGAPYVGVGSFLNGNWASFEGEPERMPTFDPSTIRIACDTVWTIWVDCMGADETATTKMLSDRANKLVKGLADHQALSDAPPAEPIICKRNEHFVCFGHGASDERATSNAESASTP